MRPSLLLLPSLALAFPVAQPQSLSSGSSYLASLREKAGKTEGGSGFRSWLEKFRGGAGSPNYHSGSDGTWDVLQPTEKAKPAKAPEPAKAKTAPAKPAPKEKPAPAKPASKEEPAPAKPASKEEPAPANPASKEKPAPEEKPAPAKEKAEEEVTATETETTEEEAPKPKPAKTAPKSEAKSEFLGQGWNPDEPKQNRGWFGLFGR
ncbi:hypothetical protein E2P81_ATG05403 [Venturia nashicola]|uniref:Uncharacterized protein n=1 Tax=Venturia nashicola TaxID=86259 RepID=A0A4Z1NZR2_9PEZI|nr:hypothetical protein E6O75_ATG05539 [Venturia nashicola]TLD32427.1 hypothetical protein E2P81_ATG05403 [Venturia nashicola]